MTTLSLELPVTGGIAGGGGGGKIRFAKEHMNERNDQTTTCEKVL